MRVPLISAWLTVHIVLCYALSSAQPRDALFSPICKSPRILTGSSDLLTSRLSSVYGVNGSCTFIEMRNLIAQTGGTHNQAMTVSGGLCAQPRRYESNYHTFLILCVKGPIMSPLWNRNRTFVIIVFNRYVLYLTFVIIVFNKLQCLIIIIIIY